MPVSSRPRLEGALQELKWRQYRRDPLLFFEECVFIPSQQDDRGRLQFKVYDHQREDLLVFRENRFVVVLKGRQIGLSTLVGAYALWLAIFHPGAVVLWISNNQENANKAIHSLNVMWQFLPDWVKERAPRLERDQAGLKEWKFADGMSSRIRAFAGTATAGASETATVVILDEFALVDGHLQDDLLRTTLPTTDAGGSLIVISTARGGHNRFAKTFRKAMQGIGTFVAVFHPWMVSHFVNRKAARLKDCTNCSGRGLVLVEGENGRRKQEYCPECVDTSIIEAKAKEFEEKPWLIHAEYPATPEEAFRESGNPVFRNLPLDDELEVNWVRGFFRRTEDGQEFMESDAGPVRIRADILAQGGPDSWRPYVLYEDPSGGVGLDFHAAHVLTWDDDALPDIVSWFHDNTIEAIDAADQLDMMGRYFHKALLAVENTGGWGGAILTELAVHKRYPNLYSYTPTDSRRRRRGSKLGFPMSWQKRPQVIDRLIEFMHDDRQVGSLHPLLRQELASFVRTEKGKLEADVGTHDDLVLSLAGALWVLVEDTRATSRPSSEETSVDVRVRLKSTMRKIEQGEAAKRLADQRWERQITRRSATRQRQKQRRDARAVRMGRAG